MSPSDASPPLEEMVRRAGLEATTIRISEIKRASRVDAEYWSPIHIENERLLDKLHKPQQGCSVQTVYDLVKRITGSAFYPSIADEYSFSEGVPFIRVADLGEFFIKQETLIRVPEEVIRETQQIATVREGDIAVAKGGSIGGICLVQPGIGECAVSRDVIAIETDQTKIDSTYLVSFLLSRVGQLQLDRYKSQQVQAHLTFPAIGNVRVVVPPRDRQMAIAALVKEALIQQAASKTFYNEAQALLTAELGLDRLDLSEGLYSVRRASETVESGRADAEYYKRKYLNLLSYLEEKSHATLEEIATFSGGATPLGADYLDEGIPFLRIQNVGENRLVLDDVAYISETTHTSLLKRSQLAPRDVLVTITGRIGTAAVVPDELKQANINQHIVRMRLKSKEVNPYYLAAFLNSVGGKLQTERESYGTTRDALPYYCLARIHVMKADTGLQNEIEQIICKAREASQDAQRLLAEAKAEVERLITGSLLL